jgi:hypothetical protein
MIPRLRPGRPNDLGLWQDHIGFSVHFLFRGDESVCSSPALRGRGCLQRGLPKLPIFLMIAVATHLVMSFAQTLMHYKLGQPSNGWGFSVPIGRRAEQSQTIGTLRIGRPDGCSAIRNGRRRINSPITLRHGSSHPRAYRLRRPRPLPPQRHRKDQPPNRFSAAFAISSPMRLRMTGLSSIGSSSYGGSGSCDGESA